MAKFYTLALRHQAEKEFGQRQSTEVARRAAAAARRQLQIQPLGTHHAFPHIREHFQEQPAKPSHGVFLPQYQQPHELTRLLLRAIDRPGTEPMLSKSDDNDWAVVIQTWLGGNNAIGYCRVGQRKRDLSHLCLVVDLNGDLITAYPTDAYRMPGNRVQV